MNASEYDHENPAPGHKYGGIVGSYKGKWYNGVGAWVDVSRGMLIERKEAGDGSCLYFERIDADEIGRAKEYERESEERQLKHGIGQRGTGKGARKATRGAFGGRRK